MNHYPADELISEREVRNMLEGPEGLLPVGFPCPAQIGPRGRRWRRSAVTQWALTQQVGQTQTRPAEDAAETRPVE